MTFAAFLQGPAAPTGERSVFFADALPDLSLRIDSHPNRPSRIARTIGVAPHLPIGIGSPDRGGGRRCTGLAQRPGRHWTVYRRRGGQARRAVERPAIGLGALVEAAPTFPPPIPGAFFDIYRRMPVEDVGHSIVPSIFGAHRD